MLARLPEGARSPAVARAIMSPSAILVGGAGVSAAILAGAALPVAAAVGAMALGARIALGLPRRPKLEPIQPARLGEPWRGLVSRALDASRRFEQVVAAATPGPLRDRLGEVGARVKVAVRESWRVGKRGDALGRAVSQLDVAAIRRQLSDAHVGGGAEREATVRALRSQLDSAERLDGVANDAHSRLTRLAAQLDEAVARTVELSLQADGAGAVGGLGSDVDGLVTELEALRLALDEADS